MELHIDRVDVWVASIKDEPGSLAHVLAALADEGADLDFIITRRAPEEPGTAVVFLTPLRGDEQIAAAAMLGFNVSTSLQSVRVEGDNEPGVAAKLTGRLADAGINLRGFSAAVIGERFILYLGLDSSEDAARAVSVLQQA